MHIIAEGIYPVETTQACHLIEVVVEDHVGPVDLMAFTQELDAQPRDNWQVPWDERVLNEDGTQDVGGRFPREVRADGTPLRLAFFIHSVNFDRPLLTPAGPIELPPPTLRPARLASLEYESPD